MEGVLGVLQQGAQDGGSLSLEGSPWGGWGLQTGGRVEGLWGGSLPLEGSPWGGWGVRRGSLGVLQQGGVVGGLGWQDGGEDLGV